MFTTITDLDCSKTTSIGGVDRKSGKKNPSQIEGYYIGTRQVASPKAKTGFSALHVFQTPEGNVGVWGKTNLDQKMTSVTPGAMTRVSFIGMQETKNNPMYKYKVEVDASNTIEVAAVSNNAGDGETNDSSDAGYDEPAAGDLYSDDEPAADVVEYNRGAAKAPQAAPPSAAQQKRVQELLRSNRSK